MIITKVAQSLGKEEGIKYGLYTKLSSFKPKFYTTLISSTYLSCQDFPKNKYKSFSQSKLYLFLFKDFLLYKIYRASEIFFILVLLFLNSK